VRERERDSREVIYRKLPRSPESHYKHWAIACMRPTSCAAKEHVSPKRVARRRLLFALKKGGEKSSPKGAGDEKSISQKIVASDLECSNSAAVDISFT